MTTKDKLYSLRLHQQLYVSNGLIVTAVPGGWLYESADIEGDTTASSFVPFIPCGDCQDSPPTDEKREGETNV